MNKLLKVIPVFMVVMVMFTSVFAIPPIDDSTNLTGTPATAVTGIAKNIWSTVILIVQILALAAVVFAGLRYMFASADQKADIKKSMGILAIGALLVFGSTMILNLIQSFANQVNN